MAKGGCWKLAGFTLLEWGELGLECRKQRDETKIALKKIEEDSDVAKNASNNQRRRDVADSTGTRSGEAIFASTAGAVTDLVPFISTLATGGLSSIPEAIGGVLGSLGGLGGGGSAAPATSTAADYLPYVVGAGALLVVVLVVTSDDGKKR